MLADALVCKLRFRIKERLCFQTRASESSRIMFSETLEEENNYQKAFLLRAVKSVIASLPLADEAIS